jgi:hypothetical protein
MTFDELAALKLPARAVSLEHGADAGAVIETYRGLGLHLCLVLRLDEAGAGP